MQLLDCLCTGVAAEDLQHVVSLLLDSALQRSLRGGRISVMASHVAHAEAIVLDVVDGCMTSALHLSAELSTEQQGPDDRPLHGHSMPSAQQSANIVQIMQRISQNLPAGTGKLSLKLAQKAASALGGGVSVHVEGPGSRYPGTRTSFRIPTHRRP